MTDCASGTGLRVHQSESQQAAELFITATPGPTGIPAGRSTEAPIILEQARNAFSGIARLLRENRAALWMERVFAPPERVEALKAIRAAAYGDLADGVEPCWLASGGRAFAGIQVHAVRTPEKPEAITLSERPVGRILSLNRRRWIAGTGLGSGLAGNAVSQASGALRLAQALLARAGADFRSVARTWFFLDDILSWYGPFNQVRNAFFREQKLIGDPAREDHLPASTGIGVSPAGGGKVALDLIAVQGDDCRIICHQATGRQRSAFEYGSAFSRSSRMPSPGGEVLFVSGTAAIDATGTSCHPGNVKAQIQMTLDNVRAVLDGAGYASREVVQAIAYCLSPEVAVEFQSGQAGEVGWPWVTVIGDVCRRELLFEIEATAARSGKRP